MPKGILNAFQPSVLIFQLSPRPDLSPKNLFHALPDGEHECIGLSRGGCRHNWGSFFASICSSDDDSAGTSSSWTIGVQIKCRQLLYTLVICSGVTSTLSYSKKSASGRKFLHRWVTKTGKEYFAPLMLGVAMSYCKSMVFKHILCFLIIRL